MSKSSVIAKPQKNIGVSQKYVVAIGASAGGLEAIHEFFDHMPNNSSFAFIVIQHLSSDYKSLLVELVSKHTHMKVFEAQQDMLIQSDCVYIIPNNKLMTFKNNRLKLADKVHDKSPNTAIDTFLLTLAHEKKEKAIAVILSGTGTDGTKGIEAIKECGGLVLVQDPKTAKFDGMPNSAITSGNADFIMPPAELHKELYNYVNQEPVKVLNNGKIDDNLLDEIFGLIYRSTGNEFNLYKTPTIIRRIARRLTATGINMLPQYVDYLKQHPDEVSTLGKEFLIGVTKFFRDTQAFDCLKKEIIPAIVDKKQDGETIKVWICACSTGEEAYSVAILLYDYIQQKKRKLEVKIFATDIDPSSIDIAAKNYYSAAAVKEVDKRLLEQYFVKEGKNYSIITPIRKQIVFARHDVIKAPPFIKNDLVTCRNMLIYMDTLLQQKVLSTFHFSLNPGGFLFLGSSETAGILKDGIQEINSKWKIYKKTGPINYSTHHTYHTGARYQTDSQVEKLRTFLKPNDRSARTIEDDFKDFVIDEFGYVGLYIDKNYEIKETIGNFRKYLSLPEKKLELNLLNMVPREASVILNTAIRKAWKENTKTTLRKVRIGHDGRDVFLNISVKPPAVGSARAYTLVLLHETADVLAEKDSSIQLNVPDAQQHEYVLELESELNETRNNLQMAVEEMDTTNEELQSSNEELLSANEELQSSNEELQSLNEELHTLNTEHQLKIRELIELNDDLDNYFKSTDIGQIFLDNNLHIRKFNPASVNMINLIDADIGRPISHISNNIKSENIMQDITTVMLANQILEKEVQLKDGRRSLMRIMPYVRKDKQRDGVIVSFVDISVITELNNIINGVFNASASAIMVFNAIRDNESGQLADLKCITANKEAVKLFGRSKEELTGLHLHHDLTQLTDQKLYDRFVKVMDTGNAMQTEFCVNNETWYHVIAAKINGGVVVTYTDINERKLAEQKLRKNYNELITARENLKKLNEELESKVQERTRKLSESEERVSLVSKATNDTIWDWSLVNNTMWRSENFTSMFGYHRSEETETIGFWFSKVHPDDRERVEKSVFEALNTGKKQWSAEYRFLKANNQYAIILDRGSVLHDEFDTPYRMLGSIVDITRLIEAEKKMSSSENRFRKVYESNMIGMIFSDNNNVIVDANDAFLNMVGYTYADISEHQLKWSDITPPEFMDVSRWAQDQLKQHGYCPAFEKQYLKKDGGRVSVLMGSAILDDDPTANTVTYIIDITEQKEAERRRKELQQLIKKQQDEFYSIFLNAPALISIRRGRELRYEFVNKAFEDFEGSNNYIGKTAEEAHTDRLGGKFTAIEKQVLKTGKPYIGKAVQVELEDQITGNLHEGWFDVIFTPVFTSNGKVDGIAFFGFDVTDLVKAQEATRQLMQKKDEFMSIASHELKTPITSLKGSLQIMQRMAANNGDIRNVHTFIDKAAKQTSRLTSLVEDLLDVTRIHAGKMMFNYSWFNAGESIKDCVEDVQANVTSHQIIIEGDADVEIYADRPRLDQVLSNFLSNSIKYSPEENKIIVTNRITENHLLYVSVKDFGIGIPGDKKDLVFDRFFRVQESSHKFSGLGLGLYISAEIIRRHHGEIGVESSEHEGSTFWFTIPVTKKN